MPHLKPLNTILLYALPFMTIADLWIAHIYYTYGFRKMAVVWFIMAVSWVVIFFLNLSYRGKFNGKHT